MMTKDVRCKRDMKSRIGHGKSSTQQEEDCFHQQIGLKFKEETSEVLCLVHNFVCCWNLYTRKVDHNVWKLLECDDGEEWRRSVGLIVWEMKKYYMESRRNGISDNQ